MGEKIENLKKENSNKIIIGSCLELAFLSDYINSDFNKITDFINKNKHFFSDHDYYNYTESISNLKNMFNTNINIMLDTLDKNEEFCNYHIKYY